jgi:hypothetical protein
MIKVGIKKVKNDKYLMMKGVQDISPQKKVLYMRMPARPYSTLCYRYFWNDIFYPLNRAKESFAYECPPAHIAAPFAADTSGMIYSIL